LINDFLTEQKRDIEETRQKDKLDSRREIPKKLNTEDLRDESMLSQAHIERHSWHRDTLHRSRPNATSHCDDFISMAATHTAPDHH
jgi:hypothetical protein